MNYFIGIFKIWYKKFLFKKFCYNRFFIYSLRRGFREICIIKLFLKNLSFTQRMCRMFSRFRLFEFNSCRWFVIFRSIKNSVRLHFIVELTVFFSLNLLLKKSFPLRVFFNRQFVLQPCHFAPFFRGLFTRLNLCAFIFCARRISDWPLKIKIH